MQLIESKTLGSAQASIEFTNIPQDGTDLLVLVSVRNTQSNTKVTRITFNGNTSSVYSSRLLYGNGSSAASYSETTTSFYGGDHPGSDYTADTFANLSVYIPNYTSSVAKSVSIDDVAENNATTSWQQISAHLWNPATQAAITSISLFPGAGNWTSGSSASLYKITKGSDGTTTVS